MEFPFHEPGLRERRRDQTRVALFEAALDEFRRVGFDRASIARIAERAGVSRPSFYFHFPTKEHVLLALQWNLEQEAVARMAGEESLGGALDAFVESLLEAEDRVGDPELFRDMVRIYARRPEGLPLADQPFPLIAEIGRHLARAAGEGQLRAGLEPARATHLFLTSVFGYLIASGGPPAARRADLRALIGLYVEAPAYQSDPNP